MFFRFFTVNWAHPSSNFIHLIQITFWNSNQPLAHLLLTHNTINLRNYARECGRCATSNLLYHETRRVIFSFLWNTPTTELAAIVPSPFQSNTPNGTTMNHLLSVRRIIYHWDHFHPVSTFRGNNRRGAPNKEAPHSSLSLSLSWTYFFVDSRLFSIVSGELNSLSKILFFTYKYSKIYLLWRLPSRTRR